MQPYRYPWRILTLDGLRASIGILVTLGPLCFLAVGRPLATLLGGVGLIFLWFGIRIVAQSMVSIMPSSEGLQCIGLRRRFLRWQDLTGIKLAYYAPIRRRNAGWYQLTLVGRNGVLRLDSTLIGFDELLRSATDAAVHARLALDPSTRENLAAWARQDGVSESDHRRMTA